MGHTMWVFNLETDRELISLAQNVNVPTRPARLFLVLRKMRQKNPKAPWHRPYSYTILLVSDLNHMNKSC